MEFRQGNINRLTTVASVDGSSDYFPMYQGSTGAMVKVTGNQISTSAGDVVGPATSVDTAIATFSGTTGKLLATPPTITASAGTLNIGASGTAGTAAVFAGTASKGKVTVTTSDNTGNTTTNLNFAAQAAARTITVPDPGVTSTNVLLADNASGQTISTGSLSVAAGTLNVGASGAAGTISVFPATASKGSTTLTMANNTGNTITNINVAAQAAARTLTVADPGTASDTFAYLAASQALTNKTISGGTNSINTAIMGDVKRCSASVTANATITYANVTGLSFTVVPGTYRFKCSLPSTVASGTGGIKYAFNYTTTVVSSIEATGIGYTASAVAVQHTTTTTTQTDLFTQAAVVIMTLIEGTMVVGTGGTIDVQMAQNTSNASNTIALIGASAEFVRIA